MSFFDLNRGLACQARLCSAKQTHVNTHHVRANCQHVELRLRTRPSSKFQLSCSLFLASTMSTTLKDIDFDDFDIDDSDSHNSFDSPDARSKNKPPTGGNGTPIEPLEVNRCRMQESRLSTEELREAALRQELENVRKMNEVLEGVCSSLEKAKNNMEVIDPLDGLRQSTDPASRLYPAP